MFGSNASTSSPFGGFGSNNNNLSTSNTGGGLFGNKPSVGGGSTTGGLFGNTSNATTSGGLFGNSVNNNPTNTTNTTIGGGLFGASNSNNTGSTGFGSAANSSAGKLFGNNPGTTTSSVGFGLNANTGSGATSGGLFGSSSNTNSNPSSGLFGSSNTNNTSSAGLFGNKPSMTTSGGLFGNKPPSATGGGLFGSSSNTNTTTSTGFGSSNAPTTGGLFGTGNKTTTGSGGLFGAQYVGQQQQQQQRLQQLSAMTRVGDLPPEIKKELEEFDKYINTQHLIAITLQSDYEKHDQLIQTLPKDINYLHNKILSTKQALKFDSNQLMNLKNLNNELTEDLNKIMQLILQLSTPGTKLSSSLQLNEFFIKKIKKYHEILKNYEDLINEANSILNGLERNCAEGFGNLFNIIEVIKSQYNLFMELCDSMAQLHSEVNRLVK